MVSALVALLGLFGLGQGAVSAATTLVKAGNFFFDPAVLNITVGDTVLWTNVSISTHDVTEGSRASGLVATNSRYWVPLSLVALARGSVTFSNIGSYPYVCNQHVFVMPQPLTNPTQTGQVNVAAFNFPPTVSLTSPAVGTRLLAPGAVTLTATSADQDGSVTNLQLFVGANMVGEGLGPTLSATVSGLPGGNYALTARVVDNLGLAVTSAPFNLVVSHRVDYFFASFSPPVLRIKPGETVFFTNTGGPHTVTGTGTEPFCGGGLVSVPFCQSTLTATGSFPYRCVFHSASQAAGMTGTVSVASFNRSPLVDLVTPASGVVLLAPATFTLQAKAFDPDGNPTSMQFINGTALVKSLQAPPYITTVSNLGPGTYNFTVRALDNLGARSTSAPVNVTVVGAIQLSGSSLAPGGFQFQYNATPGLPYVVEGSSTADGPAPFVPLATNVAVNTLETFVDGSAGTRTNRAYRVFLKP